MLLKDIFSSVKLCHSLHKSTHRPPSPASLLEHREPQRAPIFVLRTPPSPFSEHWEKKLPVDCRNRINTESQPHYRLRNVFQSMNEFSETWERSVCSVCEVWIGANCFYTQKRNKFYLVFKRCELFFYVRKSCGAKGLGIREEAICHLFLYTTVLFLTIFSLLSSPEMCLLGGSGGYLFPSLLIRI